MTGMTALQTDSVKRRYVQKIDVPALVVSVLREQGHEVTWGRAQPGQVLPYDLVWVNVAPCLSLNAPYAPEGLWAIGEALDRGRGLVLFFDDWQVRQTRSHARSFPRLQARRNQLRKQIQGGSVYKNVDLDACERELATILKGAATLAEGDARASVAVPLYAFGSLEMVSRTVLKQYARAGLTGIDPSSGIQLIHERYIPETPARQHTLAALMPHKLWVEERLRPTWPVSYFGSRKLKAERLATEADVQAACAQGWGILSPPYPQSGSGWFRSRYLYAAHLGRILVADAVDAGLVSEAHRYVAQQLHRVEALTDAQLRHIAAEQAEAFWKRVGDRDQLHAAVGSTLMFAQQRAAA